MALEIQQYEILVDELTGGHGRPNWIAPYADDMSKQQYKAVAELLNAPGSKPNPFSRPQIPKRHTFDEVFQAVYAADETGTADAVQKLQALVPLLEQAVTANNRTAMQNYASLFSVFLNDKAKSAIATLLSATEPDPGWSATIPDKSRREVLKLPTILATDIQAIEQGVYPGAS